MSAFPPGLSSPHNHQPTMTHHLQWDTLVLQQGSLVDRQTKIFLDMIDMNKSLEEKVDKSAKDVGLLTAEVEMWKRAYIQEQHANETATRDASMLREQLAELEGPKDRDPLVLALIDGDGYIFKNELLKRGLDGGREAAQMLNEKIMAHIDKEEKGGPRAQLWTYVFSNLKGLQQALVGCEVCTCSEFDAFVMGFNQANPRFIIHDVHPGKEAADAKIRAYLQTWTKFPQTLKVFFGGGHDNGYHPTLAELHNDGLLEKVVLLQGYEQAAAEIRSLRLPTFNIENLFRSEKLAPKPPAPKRQSPPSSASDSPKLSYTNVVEAFRPPPQLNLRPTKTPSPTNGRPRRLNPNVELHKNIPPPCNLFYLANCNRGADCKYAHDYLLDDEHYAMLRENSKKSPCPAVNADSTCPYGDQCALGHKCRYGPHCYHHKLGKCWFQGRSMHT